MFVYLFGQDEFLVLAEELLLPGGVLGPQGPPDQCQQNLPLKSVNWNVLNTVNIGLCDYSKFMTISLSDNSNPP